MGIEAEFVEELTKMGRKWRTLFDSRLKTRGLTLARARTLMRLAEHEGVSQRELADHLEVENATVVRLLDGLEHRGLIERRNVETDRRTKQILLTDEGRLQAEEVGRLSQEIRDDILRDTNEADLTTAVRIFHTISKRLDAAM